MKELSIYIHIPFCVRKCHYCDFLSAPADSRAQEEYIHALIGEIQKEAIAYREYCVSTIFIGGGTPTVVDAELICRVLSVVKEVFRVKENAEISMEANPGTVCEETLLKYKQAGVNRLSIGLQSALDEELARLGRIHSYADFELTYYTARKCGFTNINVDVMAALPRQSVEGYRKTLDKVLALMPPPEHISAYSLILEEGTPFFSKYSGHPEEMPDEDEERAMYYLTEQVLEQAGYRHYEISNYCRPKRECRHNLTYWKRGNYAGFGLGAASMVENVRFQNETDLNAYMQKTDKIVEKAPLSRKEQMEEFMFLGLRLMEGVSKEDFVKNFGVAPDMVYKDVIQKNKTDGLLIDGDRIRLTKKGVDISNYVMAQFLQD